MGAAAYNRGSAAISAGIDSELPSPEMRLLRDLTEYSAAHAVARPFCETVVRYGPRRGQFSLMHRPDKGFGEYSYTYDSLWALARSWRLVFIAFGEDRHSAFIRVVPGDRK